MPATLPQVPRREAGLEILYAGRMLGWKRVDTLIRAFGILERQDKAARLILIGDGPEKRKLQALVKQLDLPGAVEFQFSVPMAEVWAKMNASHVYVLPSSSYEGWGAVVNEAMSQGCAVVASEAAGSAKTMIHHGENGLLFRPGDWRQLGALLCQLSADEPLRRKLAAAGQRTIGESWSPKIGAERFLSACDALLSDHSVQKYSGGPMSSA
jgi:glycosyltransferase involved in cell wall biosynthesis